MAPLSHKIQNQPISVSRIEHGDKPSKKRKPLTKKFAHLKTKLSSAKYAMFHKKRIKGLDKIESTYNDICHQCNAETIPLMKSSKSSKSQNKKCLLIPDLNLKPIITKTSSVQNLPKVSFDVNVEQFEDSMESMQKNSRQNSQYETAFNNSVSEFSKNEGDECTHCKMVKMVELSKVPPVYWKRVNEQKISTSLPLISRETKNDKEPRETKTACHLNTVNSKQENKVSSKNQILSKYDASMYDFKRKRSKLTYSNLAKSSKNCSVDKKASFAKNVNAEGYGSVDTRNSSMFPSSSNAQEKSEMKHESIEYLFKNSIGQGDQHSLRSWMHRILSHNSDESEGLLREKPKITISTCLNMPLGHDATAYERIEKPAQRFYVLLMFCAVTCMQVIVSNTWNSITDSVLFAYPDCKPKSIALLSNWGSLSFLFCILPVCYLLHKKGLRISILVACGLCTLGAGIRCLPLGPDYFITLAHAGSILNAMGGVTYGPAVVMLSSTWFPADERTFATGVGTSLSLLGSAATYFLGPLMVSDPITFAANSHDARRIIQDEILFYITLCFIAELCMFTLLILSFPDKPEHPTSKASSVSLTLNITCLESIRLLIKNRPIILLSISSALLNGAASPWLSLLTMILTNLNISQSIAAKIGFWTMIFGCVLGLVVSKMSDRYPGYIKQNLVIFASISTVMFTWVAFMIQHIMSFSPSKLLAAILIGMSSSWATSALFYELGAEIAYPVPEGIVAGFMSSVTSLAIATVNAYVYFFSFVDVSWLTYALVLFSFSSVISLLFVNAVYNRSNLDR